MSGRDCTKRLTKELTKIKRKPIPGCSIELKKNNIQHWNISIDGPDKTPFRGGKFKFLFQYGDDYPFKPPNVKSETMVYHPNFDNKEGKICGVDILSRDGWRPMCGTREAVIGIQQLFREPNGGHPLDDDIAKVFMEDPKKFRRTAEEWTKRYAKRK